MRSRYRLAATFVELVLPGYSVNALLGYNVAMKAFLTYSVVETYCALIDVEAVTFLTHEAGELAFKECFDRDLAWEGLRVIQTRVKGKALKARLGDVLAGKVVCVDSVLRAWRHVFVHGELAAGSKDERPGALDSFARRARKTLIPYALRRVDDDLADRVAYAVPTLAAGELGDASIAQSA